jgi:predicted enzyme related to lactoylglutathione lyase
VADYDTLEPGTFCWPELSTSDQKAATQFYGKLFGWQVTDTPMGPGETYSIFKVRGRDAAAACTLRKNEKDMGVPPHWNSYVSVKNADESAKKAQSLGGTVLAPAFDVMDAGRMAVVQDPTGAVFCLWQAGKSTGAKVLGEPGALCWTELSTRDTKKAESFYTQLFGWSAKRSAPGAAMEYTEFSVNGKPGVGMMNMPPMVPAQVPPFWLPYFQVSDVDGTASKAKEMGAQVMAGPQDIMDAGRFAVLTDPQGASFAIYKPKQA